MIRVKIGDDFLDGNSLIAQTFSVNNLGSLTTRQGGFSNEFTVPLTSRNRELLGWPDDLNTSSRNQYMKIEATIYDNKSRVATGYIKIIYSTKDECRATFFSDNVAWFNLIKNKTLNELDLSDLDHVYNESNVTGSLSNTSGYIYPIIDYGEFLDDSVYNWEVDQFYPGVYISTIVEQIFLDAGWKITGELINDPMYKRMIIPFSKKEFAHPDSFITDNTFTEDFLDQNVVNNEIITLDPSGTTFNPTQNAEYTIRLTMTVSNYNATANSYWVITDSTNFAITENYFGNGTYVFQTEGYFDATSNVFVLHQKRAGTFTDMDISDVSIEFIPKKKIYLGSTITVAETLPDIKQSDLMQYIFTVFGVVPVANPLTKIVTAYLHKNIKGRINSAVDWSDKIDVSKSYKVDFTELLSNYATTSIFNYLKDDDDSLLETYTAQNNKRLGQGELIINNEHLTNRKTIYEAPFAGTINAVHFSQSLYVPVIPWLNETGEVTFNPKPRVLLIEPEFTVNELSGGVYDSVDIGSTTVTELPFAWFVKAPYTTNTDAIQESLSFGDVQFTTVVEGTLENYWADYQQILSNMKYVKAFLRLDAVDIANLQFQTPVYIDKFKSYFYINSINEFSGGEDLTEVELIKYE